MAAAVTADFRGFPELQRKIDKLVGLMGAELREGIGAILESSARRRVSETKRGPDGAPWPVWSRGYAEHRPGGKSLLQDSGALLDSIQFEVGRDSITVFAATEYAATHQFGDERTVTIKAHARLVKQAFGKSLKGPTYQRVGEHTQKRNIPPRPFLGLGNEDVHEIERLVDGLAEEAFR